MGTRKNFARRCPLSRFSERVRYVDTRTFSLFVTDAVTTLAQGLDVFMQKV